MVCPERILAMKLGFAIPIVGSAVVGAAGLSAFCRGLEDLGYDTLWVGDRGLPVDQVAGYRRYVGRCRDRCAAPCTPTGTPLHDAVDMDLAAYPTAHGPDCPTEPGRAMVENDESAGRAPHLGPG
jgi:hypothetical protein